MLTGRRVDDRHGGHGYTGNFDTGGTVHRTAGHYVASVFDVVHDDGGSTAMFASKAKFRLYRRTWNTHGAADRTGRNDGRAKIDRVTIDLNNTRLVAKLTAELRRRPRGAARHRRPGPVPDRARGRALWASGTSPQCSTPIGS